MAWERRECERLPLRADVWCDKYILDTGEDVPLTNPVKLEITDVSVGGIGFFTTFPLKPNSFFTFFIKVDADTNIMCKVRICWVENEDYKYRVGAAFVNNEDDNEKIRAYFNNSVNNK